MSTLGDPPSPLVNFWRPPPSPSWVDVNKERSLIAFSLGDIVLFECNVLRERVFSKALFDTILAGSN